MTNLRNIFNPFYSTLLQLFTFILFIVLIISKKNLNRLGKIITYTSITIIIINFIIKLIIIIFPNSIIKIFLKPILNNINNNIFICMIVSLFIGIIFLILDKKNKTR